MFRSLQYFTLGTSLGPIIDIQNPIDFIKSLVSLLQEYEGFSNNDGMKQKRVKYKGYVVLIQY
jgi:hypothetical protein